MKTKLTIAFCAAYSKAAPQLPTPPLNSPFKDGQSFRFFAGCDGLELLIDVQQASIETLKAVTGLVIGELAPVHFQKVPRSEVAVETERDGMQ